MQQLGDLRCALRKKPAGSRSELDTLCNSRYASAQALMLSPVLAVTAVAGCTTAQDRSTHPSYAVLPQLPNVTRWTQLTNLRIDNRTGIKSCYQLAWQHTLQFLLCWVPLQQQCPQLQLQQQQQQGQSSSRWKCLWIWTIVGMS